MSLANPLKRTLSLENRVAALPAAKRIKSPEKKERVEDMYNKIASFENANRVRQDPPVAKLQQAIQDAKKETVKDPGRCVVYWMRMQDMRGELYLWSEPLPVDINTLQLRTTVQLPLHRHMQMSIGSL
jgi:hypothetical protein